MFVGIHYGLICIIYYINALFYMYIYVYTYNAIHLG